MLTHRRLITKDCNQKTRLPNPVTNQKVNLWLLRTKTKEKAQPLVRRLLFFEVIRISLKQNKLSQYQLRLQCYLTKIILLFRNLRSLNKQNLSRNRQVRPNSLVNKARKEEKILQKTSSVPKKQELGDPTGISVQHLINHSL